MYRSIWTLLSALLLGLVAAVGLAAICRAQAPNGSQPPVSITGLGQARTIAPIPAVRDMLGRVDRDRALGDLRRLTGDEPLCAAADCYTIANRLTGSEGLRQATDYLGRELASLGYAVEFRKWSRSGRSDRNLIARKPGTAAADEEIYLIAHVDGVKPGGAARYAAADDNASGAGDLIEAARVLSSHTFSRTLVLLFTTGEEQGTLGAKSYLGQLTPQELSRVKAAVDVDVVGYDANRDGVMELWHGGEAPSIAVTRLMSETIVAYQLALTPQFAKGCG